MQTISLLRNVKVLDLSRILAGPWATQLLADLGADVIKVEKPSVGDDTRSWGPPFYSGSGDGEEKTAAYFTCCNRGKRSITVDFQKKEGRDIIYELASKSDVVFENFLPGTLNRLKLGYQDLAQVNSKIIMVSISGFGQHGPRKSEAGYDFMAQGMSGLMSITGLKNQPVKTGVAVVDVMTGLYASNAALAALHSRSASGVGQHIDLSLFNVAVAMLANQGSNYLATGVAPGTAGNGHPNIAPYDVVTAADKQFILAVGNDAQFGKVCEVLGLGSLAHDSRFVSNSSRVKHRADLLTLLNASFPTQNSDAWLVKLHAVGVPCGPLNDIGEAFADKHSSAHRLRRSVEYDLGDAAHGESIRIDTVANPIQVNTGTESVSLTSDRGIPALGAHTSSVLREELGYSQETIQRLREDHCI